MQLELRNICKKVGREFHISDVSLTFDPGTLNILLGPTLSGKTSLMRLMAGLDQPKEQDPSYWLNLPGSPKPKLANEKPRGMTVDYDELVKSWAASAKK
jgi:ABC-type multidrug transport system ATPase subunit